MLKIVVNSDKNIELNHKLIGEIEAIIHHRLARFDERLSRIVLQVSDKKSSKPGLNNIRCMIEARPKGMESINVSDHANSLNDAVNHGVQKLDKKLQDKFGRLAS